MKGVVMRAVIVAILLLLTPVALLATPTLGVFFYEHAKMTYSPTLLEEFDGCLYAGNAGCWITGIEYLMVLPSNIELAGWDLPTGSLEQGDPISEGHTVVFSHALNGYTPGYNLICTYHFLAADDCTGSGGEGGLSDSYLFITETSLGYLRGTCSPYNDKMDYVGMSSLFCPVLIGTQDASWGAIKSIF
jgi:hypothetical protein